MAEVSGETFSSLVETRVFQPAGMSRSARIHRSLPLRPELADALAVPYHLDAAGIPARSNPPPPQGDGAAGGVIASAADLALLDIALTEGRLLSPEFRAQLFSPARTPGGESLPYGLGWFLGRDGEGGAGRRLAWHSGLWEERYSALYLKVLKDEAGAGLTLILLANSDGLRWESRLDEAAIQRSPFAAAFLTAFPR